jgi:hypothetical protein
MFKEHEFYNDFLSINTCKKSGLDNWGKILDEPPYYVVDLSTENIFGYSGSPISEKYKTHGYSNGVYWCGINNFDNIEYTEEQYRYVLKLKYLNLIADRNMINATKIINDFFLQFNERNKVKVYFDISIPTTRIYECNFILENWQNSILHNKSLNMSMIGCNVYVIQGSLF